MTELEAQSLAAIAQKLSDLYENLYGRDGQGDMLLIRERSHVHANMLEKHELQIGLINSFTAACSASHDKRIEAFTDSIQSLQLSRAKFWGLIIGISVASSMGSATLFGLIAKTFGY